MNAKEFLKQYEYAALRAKQYREQYETALEKIDAIGSTLGTDGMPHGSGVSRKTEDLAIKLGEAAQRYLDAEQEAFDIKEQVYSMIADIEGYADWDKAAQYFWETVVDNRSITIGGNSVREHFHPAEDFSSMLESEQGPETCNTYNMLRLTKMLYETTGDTHYMDYYERVLYNQIVGSLHPEHYLTTYHYAVGLNASKPWGNRTPQESCCGGTGSENHVKYQEAAYFTSKDCIWVGLYLPSVAEWDEQGITLEQECTWPAEHSTIRITKGRGKFAMKLRIPYWATEGVKVTLNGEEVAAEYAPRSYVTIASRKLVSVSRIKIKPSINTAVSANCHE